MVLEDRVWPLQRFKEHHLQPGSFFASILKNDLRGACAFADASGRQLLYLYVKWCESNLPEESWGSEEKYESWIAKREGIWRANL